MDKLDGIQEDSPDNKPRELLCYGIIHCLWGLDSNNLQENPKQILDAVYSQINQITYYFQSNVSSHSTANFLWAALAGIEWYLFLNYHLPMTPNPQLEFTNIPSLPYGFESLLYSLFNVNCDRQIGYVKTANTLVSPVEKLKRGRQE